MRHHFSAIFLFSDCYFFRNGLQACYNATSAMCVIIAGQFKPGFRRLTLLIKMMNVGGRALGRVGGVNSFQSITLQLLEIF